MKTIADLSAPKDVTRKYLEKDVQKQCVDWARARGYWARKFSSQSQRSVPDYLFAKSTGGPYGAGLKFAVEFKAPGKHHTAAQFEEQKAMRLAGWFCFNCDNFGTFERCVVEMETKGTYV